MPRRGDDSVAPPALPPAFEAMLDRVRTRVCEDAPDLVTLFDEYANESRFGRELIDAELRQISPASRVLEVGAGALLLALGLTAEGFDVVAIEPVGLGFDHMQRLGSHAIAVALEDGLTIELVDVPAEQYIHEDAPVALAFAINVMEHVSDPAEAIRHVCAGLAPGATFQFVCPNYRFPYEPHFNSLTLGTRSLTERFLAKRWIERATFPDPAGTWESLNWITTTTVRGAVSELPGVHAKFSREATLRYLGRASASDSFAERKGAGFSRIVGIARRLGAERVVRILPSAVLPVIDCRITRA